MDALAQAAAERKAALVAVATPDAPTELAVYLNNERAPFTILAPTTDAARALYVPLTAPDDAGAAGAEFWRKLVSNVRWTKPGEWGTQKVVLGLSRAGSAAAVPEATAVADATGAGGSFDIYVYSVLPFALGLGSLLLFTGAMSGYAARRPRSCGTTISGCATSFWSVAGRPARRWNGSPTPATRRMTPTRRSRKTPR